MLYLHAGSRKPQNDFERHLLKEMQETGGMINFGLLSDRIHRNVSNRAPQLKMRKSQTPATNATPQVADQWRSMQF